MGTWSFRARLGGNYAHTCAGAGRCRAWLWLWVRVRYCYPAWFFLNRVSRVWVARIPEPDPLRPAIRIQPAPVGQPTVATVGQPTGATVGSNRWSEPLQPFVGFRPVGPSWSAINSAPVSHSKHTNNKHKNQNNSLSLSAF